MGSTEQNLSLGEAANNFLADLSTEERGTSQQEIYKFVRWFGVDHPLAGLTAAEVANYAERLSQSDSDYMRKLEPVRVFLTYAKKKGWSKSNMSTHLRIRTKKGKTKQQSLSRQKKAETVFLTQQGYDEMEAELLALQGKRLEVIDEIRRAAADKDFRENVPFHAAREQSGQIQGRIIELEAALKLAVVVDRKEVVSLRVGAGDSIVLTDLDSGEELRYTLVSAREVDPAKGKISSASPIGQAVMGKEQGEAVEVAAPAGKLRYQIKKVEH